MTFAGSYPNLHFIDTTPVTGCISEVVSLETWLTNSLSVPYRSTSLHEEQHPLDRFDFTDANESNSTSEKIQFRLGGKKKYLFFY